MEYLSGDTTTCMNISDGHSSPSSDQEETLYNEGQAPFVCTECGKTFALLCRFQRHQRIHSGEKPFSCEFCSKRFSVKENLNVHRRIHTKERPYKCTICKRAFEHSGKLHRHMRTHTGERPHKCQICNKTFVQSGQLVIHMRAHTGEKPYTCDYCKKGFTCSKQLKVHLRTHTGEKPYECDVCGKTFGYNHVLKMHKLSHLGEKLYKCTICEEFFNCRKTLDRHIKGHDEADTDVISIEGSVHSPRLHASPRPPLSPPLTSSSSNEDSHCYHRRPSIIAHHALPTSSSASSLLPSDVMSYSLPFQQPEGQRGGSPMGALTPPRSPNARRHSYTSPIHNTTSAFADIHFYPDLSSGYLQLASGDRVPCPSHILHYIREEQHRMTSLEQKYLTTEQALKNHVQMDNIQHRREESFNSAVLQVLQKCLEEDKLRMCGYPHSPICDIVINVLRRANISPCIEPSLTPINRTKINLRYLLEECVPDEEMWKAYGWKEKSIEDIVVEFLKKA